MAQRFKVSKYKSVLPTRTIPDPRDPVGADSYTYTSDKYTYTSDKYAGVVDEPVAGRAQPADEPTGHASRCPLPTRPRPRAAGAQPTC